MALLALSAVDLLLAVRKVRRKAYFYVNAVVQIPILVIFGGLFPPVFAFLFLDLAILALLPEKSPEELLKHPPVPITRNFRLALAGSVAVLLASMVLPWITVSGDSVSLLGFYYAVIAHTGLPTLSVPAAQGVLALMCILLPPFSLILGLLGMVKRRASVVSGALAITAGLPIPFLLGSIAGLGSYVSVASGIIAITAFVLLRPRRIA